MNFDSAVKKGAAALLEHVELPQETAEEIARVVLIAVKFEEQEEDVSRLVLENERQALKLDAQRRRIPV